MAGLAKLHVVEDREDALTAGRAFCRQVSQHIEWKRLEGHEPSLPANVETSAGVQLYEGLVSRGGTCYAIKACRRLHASLTEVEMTLGSRRRDLFATLVPENVRAGGLVDAFKSVFHDATDEREHVGVHAADFRAYAKESSHANSRRKQKPAAANGEGIGFGERHILLGYSLVTRFQKSRTSSREIRKMPVPTLMHLLWPIAYPNASGRHASLQSKHLSRNEFSVTYVVQEVEPGVLNVEVQLTCSCEFVGIDPMKVYPGQKLRWRSHMAQDDNAGVVKKQSDRVRQRMMRDVQRLAHLEAMLPSYKSTMRSDVITSSRGVAGEIKPSRGTPSKAEPEVRQRRRSLSVDEIPYEPSSSSSDNVVKATGIPGLARSRTEEKYKTQMNMSSLRPIDAADLRSSPSPVTNTFLSGDDAIYTRSRMKTMDVNPKQAYGHILPHVVGCAVCSRSFSTFRRKHRCQECHHDVCSSCVTRTYQSDTSRALTTGRYKVCRACADQNQVYFEGMDMPPPTPVSHRRRTPSVDSAEGSNEVFVRKEITSVPTRRPNHVRENLQTPGIKTSDDEQCTSGSSTDNSEGEGGDNTAITSSNDQMNALKSRRTRKKRVERRAEEDESGVPSRISFSGLVHEKRREHRGTNGASRVNKDASQMGMRKLEAPPPDYELDFDWGNPFPKIPLPPPHEERQRVNCLSAYLNQSKAKGTSKSTSSDRDIQTVARKARLHRITHVLANNALQVVNADIEDANERWTVCSVALIDDKKGYLIADTSMPPSNEQNLKHHQFAKRRQEILSGYALYYRQSFFVQDLESDDRLRGHPILFDMDARSYLSIPIWIDTHIVGTLDFYTTKERKAKGVVSEHSWKCLQETIESVLDHVAAIANEADGPVPEFEESDLRDTYGFNRLSLDSIACPSFDAEFDVVDDISPPMATPGGSTMSTIQSLLERANHTSNLMQQAKYMASPN